MITTVSPRVAWYVSVKILVHVPILNIYVTITIIIFPLLRRPNSTHVFLFHIYVSSLHQIPSYQHTRAF